MPRLRAILLGKGLAICMENFSVDGIRKEWTIYRVVAGVYFLVCIALSTRWALVFFSLLRGQRAEVSSSAFQFHSHREICCRCCCRATQTSLSSHPLSFCFHPHRSSPNQHFESSVSFYFLNTKLPPSPPTTTPPHPPHSNIPHPDKNTTVIPIFLPLSHQA